METSLSGPLKLLSKVICFSIINAPSVTIKKIKKGEIFSEENIWTKRPGTGIPAKNYENILGKISNTDIENNTLLNIDDIQK